MTTIATAGSGEASLLDLAETLTAAQLEPLCRTLDDDDDEPGELGNERSVRSRQLESGMVHVTVQLLPEEEAVVIEAIETALRGMDGNGAPADRQGRPMRTRRPLLRRTTTDAPKKASGSR